MHEKVSRTDYIKVFIGFIGVMLITKPEFIQNIFGVNIIQTNERILGIVLCLIYGI